MKIDPSALFSELAEGIIANFVLIIFSFLYRRSRVFLEGLHPFARPIAIGLLSLVFLGINIFILSSSLHHSIILFILSSCIFGLVIFAEFEVFWRLGILGADRTIAKGIDYKKSLNLCKDSLEFLGIGASKLVADRDTFRSAINRCHRDERPIRFLLCPPDSPNLLEVARRANRPEREYQENVKNSLRELRSLKVDHAKNIAVKFYLRPPLFRLMFINNSICLASHYILGEGDGSQLPQMHICRKPPARRDNESFYYPLRRYYEQLWEEAQEWDFKSHT
jgi:hypothetical protein